MTLRVIRNRTGGCDRDGARLLRRTAELVPQTVLGAHAPVASRALASHLESAQRG